ncbi:12983_t:CDS:1 [Funneliformis geosporum]|uniref:8469_t:CDS:1 n=1 Tax=Funneliformis geosporum TaxID=1117311 RepID=A0A9W4T345_9GLOM|nr:12983_t:CDS:1 [Funneliformis geosporum]CAI2190781.1 8469_t:CDS:1 [Funneliformis geosporum]
MSQLVLVASAMSTMLKTPVKTYDECVANGYEVLPEQILDINTVHSLLLFRHETGERERNTEYREPSESSIQIFVKTLSGESRAMFVFPYGTVLRLKQDIQAILGYDITQMRLELAGRPLEDHRTLASYNIQHGDNVYILFRLLGGGFSFFVINKNFLNSKYDYDFTNLKDKGTTFIRGKVLYNRPYGWERIALNVSGKYGSDDKWLGCVGNSSDEWPVSYHGTNKDCADSIADKGYLLSKGKRFKHGKGIYSSPIIEVAADPYAVKFDHNGVKYKIVFQNRVNPVGLKKIDDIAYWVTPDEKNIRPYGLCIKKFNSPLYVYRDISSKSNFFLKAYKNGQK